MCKCFEGWTGTDCSQPIHFCEPGVYQKTFPIRIPAGQYALSYDITVQVKNTDKEKGPSLETAAISAGCAVFCFAFVACLLHFQQLAVRVGPAERLLLV